MVFQINKEYIKGLQGLESFSHIDVLWWFDICDNNSSRSILEVNKPYTPSLDRVEKPSVPKWCSNWPLCCEESGDFD